MPEDAGAAVEAPTLPTDATQLLRDVLAHRGWDEREGQVNMVRFIHDSIEEAPPGANVDVTTNAPVGTGKTLAYLLAGLSRGERIIVATSTKSLQDQIVNEELPQLAADLKAIYGYDLTYGVLKGKSNYVCMEHATKMIGEDLPDDEEDLLGGIVEADARDVDKIREMIEITREAQATRDIARYDAEWFFPSLTNRDTRQHLRASHRCATRSEPWVPRKSSDEYVDSDDPFFFGTGPVDWEERRAIAEGVATTSFDIYRAAYAHCMTSQIVVLNTTLLVFELMKAQRKFADDTPALLNGVSMIVVDEAHHLARILADAHSVELSFDDIRKSVDDLVKKMSKRYEKDPDVLGDLTSLPDMVERTESALIEVEEGTSKEKEFREGIQRHLNNMSMEFSVKLTRFLDRVARHQAKNPGEGKLDRNGRPKAVSGLVSGVFEDVVSVANEVSSAAGRRFDENRYSTNVSMLGGYEDDHLSIKVVPIDVSFFRGDLTDICREQNYYVGPPEPLDKHIMLLCSGTITSKTPTLVGMKPDNYIDVPTPFDSRRVRLCVPGDLPEPSAREWARSAWDTARAAIMAAGGRTLFLTTSNKMLREFTEMAESDLPFSVYSQAHGRSKRALVGDFKEDEHSVLFGTIGFWEGVDVPGPACSLVIMDKMPFPMKDDPIFAARRKYIEETGGNPFMQVDVDHASVMVAQGAGRLIRSVDDIGGVMILDSRINSKRYGDSVISLLPADWPMTTSTEAFLEWMEWVNPDTREGEMPLPDPDDYRRVKPERRGGRKLRTAR